MEQDNQTYVTGFNAGYKLNKYSPELFEKLKESLNAEVEYDRGLLEGAAQATLEKEQQRLKELGELDKGNEQDVERE